ncbi:MAG: DUF998 domain-containing protein [Armatimonadetes bacterium]|nr:DUF998 domain-containing protein [Armatimonadota bacterium]
MREPRKAATRWTWGAVFGLAAVGFYVLFTVVAVILFPNTVSPLDTYLSQLGNADSSPDGWLFYDLAVILAGLCAIPFYVGMSRSYANDSRRWLTRIGLVAGIANGVSVLMSGVFAEHVNMDVHVFWSYLIFFSFIPVLLVYGLILWKVPGASKFVASYGFIVGAIDICLLVAILTSGLGSGVGSIMEWVSVFTYLAWVALVSVGRLGRSRADHGV